MNRLNPRRPATPLRQDLSPTTAYRPALVTALMLFGVVSSPAGFAQQAHQGTENVSTLPAVTVTDDSISDDPNGPVRAYVAKQSTLGTKTATSILETPQSVSVLTRQQLDLQQPASTSQALRYSAGVNSEKYGGFGDHLDLTKIRGLDADYYLDGLRVISNTGSWTPQVDPYTLERVEILRGPSSAIYGQSAGGGIVNQVTRKPEDIASHEVSLQLGNVGRKQIGVDTTGPLNESKTLLYRLTATALDTDGQVEDVRHKRLYIAPSLTWRPDQQTSWTVMATHSREPDIPNYNSLPAAALGLNGSRYPQIDRGRNYTDMNFSDSSRSQDSLSSLFEHKFGDDWSFHSNLRYLRIDAPLQRSVVYGFQDVAGKMFLRNTYEQAPGSSDTLSMDNHLRGKLTLGATTHTVLLGVDYAKGTVRNSYYSYGPVLANPYGSAYRPAATPDFTASRSRAPYDVHQTFDRLGVYAQDQIAYERWRLTLSARHDRSKTDDRTQSYSPTWKYTQQDDSKWSGRAGLSYQFDSGLAPYVSHATSFDPLLGSDYSGKSFVPMETRQTEIGVKYQPQHANILLSAAIFQLNQTNVKTSDANHLGFNSQAGEARTRGLDLQATTGITRDLNLIASYTYLDNALIKDASYQGKRLTQTPRHSASAWLDYRIASGPLAGLQVGGGVRYLGTTYGDPANTFKVPAATLFDLALNYDLGLLSSEMRGASVALNVNNLTNKQYVASCTSTLYCFIGQDRSVSATLRYRW